MKRLSKRLLLPADHPSIYWRTLKNSVTFAVNAGLYHETVGMYPIVFGNYYTRSLAIHRLVTPVIKEEDKRWIHIVLKWYSFVFRSFRMTETKDGRNGEEKACKKWAINSFAMLHNKQCANHWIEIFWFFFTTSSATRSWVLMWVWVWPVIYWFSLALCIHHLTQSASFGPFV